MYIKKSESFFRKSLKVNLFHYLMLNIALSSLFIEPHALAMNKEIEDVNNSSGNKINKFESEKFSYFAVAEFTPEKALELYQKKQSKKQALPEANGVRGHRTDTSTVYFFYTGNNHCEIVGKHLQEPLKSAYPCIQHVKNLRNFIDENNKNVDSANLLRIIQYKGTIYTENAGSIVLFDKADGEDFLKCFYHGRSAYEEWKPHAYNMGLQLGNFYARNYRQNKIMLHEDLHLENIFYDKEKSRVCLIDTESLKEFPIEKFRDSLARLFDQSQTGPHIVEFFYVVPNTTREMCENEIQNITYLFHHIKEGLLEGIKANQDIPMDTIKEFIDQCIDRTYQRMKQVLEMESKHLAPSEKK